MTPEAAAKLNKICARVGKGLEPPEDLTVSEWCDKYRRLSKESSQEYGQWETSRTPYLKEILDCFTDPKVRCISIIAPAQMGKTEAILCFISYIIDQDPGSIIFGHPTIDDAKKFSTQRIKPMLRDTPRIRNKVKTITGRDKRDTVLQQTFPGGILTLVGSGKASALAGTPARYIFGDERDRWAKDADREGDPWSLAQARQTTFYNAKSVEVSTPTLKGESAIEEGYEMGTQEIWAIQCPDCQEWHEIKLDDIKWPEVKVTKVGRKKIYTMTGDAEWCCPSCGTMHTETEAKNELQWKWIAKAPQNLERGRRSFRLNAFSSPWVHWNDIVLKFYESKDDQRRLQVFHNTVLGESFEARGGLISEDEVLARREDYGLLPDGSAVEVPDGVLCLTMGVDTQDNRFEYEVVGHGLHGETWGIEKGMIMGRPDTEEAWQQLEDVVHRHWHGRDGDFTIEITCIDSGGHFTQDVYENCKRIMQSGTRFFPIKGIGGDGVPFIKPPTIVKIRDSSRNKTYLYNVGVDAGKRQIMNDIQKQDYGPHYSHFPRREEAGYDSNYFYGLLSEKAVPARTSKGTVWRWEKLPGHERNESLDCRNYALAALRIFNPDLEARSRKAKAKAAGNQPDPGERQQWKTVKVQKTRRGKRTVDQFDGW